MAIINGWGRGTWGEGAWGSPISVTVGGGGPATDGGQNSVFDTLTAYGGA